MPTVLEYSKDPDKSWAQQLCLAQFVHFKPAERSKSCNNWTEKRANFRLAMDCWDPWLSQRPCMQMCSYTNVHGHTPDVTHILHVQSVRPNFFLKATEQVNRDTIDPLFISEIKVRHSWKEKISEQRYENPWNTKCIVQQSVFLDLRRVALIFYTWH